MESHPQNPEFKNNPENFHPFGRGGHLDHVTWTVCCINLHSTSAQVSLKYIF